MVGVAVVLLEGIVQDGERDLAREGVSWLRQATKQFFMAARRVSWLS